MEGWRRQRPIPEIRQGKRARIPLACAEPSFWVLLVSTAVLSSQQRLQRSKNSIDFCDQDSLSKVCNFYAVLRD